MFPILAFSAPGPPLPDLEEIDAGGPWVVGEWDSSDNEPIHRGFYMVEL